MARHTATVNRSLSDPAMDRIDHALGRPADPMAATYRNYYAVDKVSAKAEAMRMSPHWAAGRAIPGDLQCFVVTPSGRAALTAHLREIGDPHRSFVVSFDGSDPMIIAARSHGAARYAAFLRSDLDLTFGDFVRRTSVRLEAAQ